MLSIKQIVLFLLISLVFTSCGYKPSSKFSRNILGDKVSTSVVISQVNPENTVLIKDAIDSAIVETLHASLTSRDNSQSHLIFSISNPSYRPVQYDKNGYIIAYRMNIVLNVSRYKDGKVKKYTAKGTHDFAITPNAVVTDQDRFDAIKFSAAKAIESFIASISSEGANKK